jgi:dihydrofolate synthase/folylpolyglutamate synthase
MSVGSAVHDYASALEFLYDRINYERTSQIPYRSAEFKLDRMRDLMRRLGEPQHRVPTVHVAGTKGKGSTSAMIAAVLQKAGYCTGLYTSPHLDRIEERFAIDGEPCSPLELVELAAAVAPHVRAMDDEAAAQGLRGPTFFEITTAMMFVHFARRPVAIAVLEVGLGGRLDSTNVCQPAVSVITSISLDHTSQLGNTLEAIAAEKAGILRPGIPAISGVVAPGPREVIEQIAAEQGALLRQRNRDFSAVALPANDVQGLHGLRIAYQATATGRRFDDLSLSLLGQHQVENAATAIAALEVLAEQGWNVPESALRAGLADTRCPARLEVVQHVPLLIVDTAHNTASIEALCRTVAPLRQRPRILVFATSRDKDLAGMVPPLLEQFDHIVLTKYVNNPRARPLAEVVPVVQEAIAQRAPLPSAVIHETEHPLEAWEQALRLATPGALICITGSFFLAAELRPVIAAASAAQSLLAE